MRTTRKLVAEELNATKQKIKVHSYKKIGDDIK
jgi:hypothetical protein